MPSGKGTENMRIIVTTAFAIISFATMANAQANGKLYLGTNVGVYVSVAPSASSLPTVDLIAGRAIKLRPLRTSISGRVTSIAVDELEPIRTYQMPCEGEPAVARMGSGTPLPSVTDLVLDNFNTWSTKPEWKGTCRLLVAKFRDGSEGRVRLRFR